MVTESEFHSRPWGSVPPQKLIDDLFYNISTSDNCRVLSIGTTASDSRPFLPLPPQCLERISEGSLDALTTRFSAEEPGLRIHDPASINPHGRNLYDLVLVEHSVSYHGDLCGRLARMVTASLLSQIRPEGTLAFIGRQRPPLWPHMGHRAECYAHHLSTFPGKFEIHEYPDAWHSPSVRQWWQRSRQKPGFFTATLTTPAAPLSPEHWMRVAAVLSSYCGPCCEMGHAVFSRAA